MIKQWLEARKKRQREREYQRGFGWAMSAFFLEEQSIEEIEAYIYNLYEPFDLGAGEAIGVINKGWKGYGEPSE